MTIGLCIKTTVVSLVLILGLLVAYVVVPYWTLPTQGCCWTRTIPQAASTFDWTPDAGRPLNALFMTWGSRGDHQPNIALGLELSRRGVNVTVMGLEKYRHLIEQHHSDSFHYALHTDRHIWILAESMSQGEGTDFLSLTVDYITNSSHELVDQYIHAAKDSHADILFGSHSSMLLLHHVTVAQALQKPMVLLTHDVWMPSRHQSFNLQENRVKDYGAFTNMLGYRIYGTMMGWALPNAKWRKFRSDLGLPTPWFWDWMHPSFLADFPILSTSDMTLWPRPGDHPPQWYATGYFVTRSGEDAANDDPETAELVQWIQDRKALHGRPLFYFGQGSFDHHEREIVTDMLLDAVDKMQMDAITLKTTVDERFETRPLDHVRVVEQLNQDVVFPMCSVISHHGGAGTASQVLRSGRPGLCIPSMPFQQIWGGRMEEYGAGVMILPSDMETAWEANRTNLLIPAIEKALQKEVVAKAKELQEIILAQPDGVKVGADVVLHHVRELVKQHQGQTSEFKPEL